LRDALNSLQQQTYRNFEIVLVDAAGDRLAFREPAHALGRVECVGLDHPLTRPAAANLGLRHASGRYIAFLDDDDWFAPDHLFALITRLKAHPECGAVYSGVACVQVGEKGQLKEIRNYNEPFNRIRLLVQNFIPIHAVLFNSRCIDRGIRFDESLSVFEDWDFWLSLSSHTSFLHVPEITAYYRISSTSGFGAHEFDAGQAAAYAEVVEKWRARWSVDELVAIAQAAAIATVPPASPASPATIPEETDRASMHPVPSLEMNRRAGQFACEPAQSRMRTEPEHRVTVDDARVLDRLARHTTNIHSSMSWRLLGPLLRLEQRHPRLVHSVIFPVKLLTWTLAGRLAQRLRVHRLARHGIASREFDVTSYLKQNPHAIEEGYDPALHWAMNSVDRGWDGSYTADDRCAGTRRDGRDD
jgi:hypothetical protein